MLLNGAPLTAFPQVARTFIGSVWQQICSNISPAEDVPGPPIAATPFATPPLHAIPERLLGHPPSEPLRVSLEPPDFLLRGEIASRLYDALFEVVLAAIIIILVIFLVSLALFAILRWFRARPPPGQLANDVTGMVIRAVGAGRSTDEVYSTVICNLQALRRLNKALEVDGKPTPNRSAELGPEDDPVTPARTSPSTRQRRASPAPTRDRQRQAESPLPTREQRASPSATRQRRASACSTQQRRASEDSLKADDDVQLHQNHVMSDDDENGDRHEHASAPSTQQRRAPRADYPDDVQQHHVVRNEDEDRSRDTFDGDRGFMVDEEEEEDETASMHNILNGVDAPREGERFGARQPRSFRGM
ncbi:hypothetical protein H1R20_g13170, partial [Candolleomyces eurysporus]